MKKVYFAAIAAISLIPLVSNAQWTPQGATLGSISYSGGNVGIGTNNPNDLLYLDAGANRKGLTISSDGNVSAYTDITLPISTTGSIANGAPLGWVISHRKDGYFSDATGGSSLEFYAYLKGGGYYAPLCFKPNGDIVLASYRNALGGNVGIGTTNPNVPLHVSKAGNNVTGNLTLLSTFTDPTGIKGISLGYNQASQAGIIYSENNTGTGSPLEFWTYNGSSFAPRMTFTQAGKLGIGTTTPDELLSVNGTIHSKEIKVNLTGLPDYVFKPDYHLPTLSEVKSYIDKNNHLPEMPSAQEVEKNGLNLGEMNKLLLKKVEELTLYLIEQKQEIDKLKSEVKTLNDK